MDARELRDLPCGSPYTATDVQNLHTLFEIHGMGQVVLMTSDGLTKGFAIARAAEVEGLAPAVLVKVSYKVIIPIRSTKLVDYHTFKAVYVCAGGSIVSQFGSRGVFILYRVSFVNKKASIVAHSLLPDRFSRPIFEVSVHRGFHRL